MTDQQLKIVIKGEDQSRPATDSARANINAVSAAVTQNAGITESAGQRVVSSNQRSALSFSGVGAAVNAVKIGLLAFFAGVASAVGGLARSGAETQKLKASLETVTGSAKNAQAAFKLIEDFASSTPFQLDEVVGAFIKLKALGLDPSKDALLAYGNTASAMGKSLDQFIEAVADAATGEFERLKEFGIKARQQGDSVSLTFQGVTTTIGNNAAEIEQYLRGIGTVQFAGAMERQMSTIGGLSSNLVDQMGALARSIGEEGGFNAAYQSVLQGLIKFTTQVVDGIKGSGDEIAVAFDVVGRVLLAFGNGVKLAFNVIQIGVKSAVALIIPPLELITRTLAAVTFGEASGAFRLMANDLRQYSRELKAGIKGDLGDIGDAANGFSQAFSASEEKAQAAAKQSADEIAKAEADKTKAMEEAARKQQVSFERVEKATKALTAAIDAEAQRQTIAIEQALSERLAAIDAMGVGEAEKDRLRVSAKLASYQQETQLQQKASEQKLGLIDQEYARELDAARKNVQQTRALETEKRQAKLAVYTGLAEYYQSEVARLSGVYASEFQMAAQAKQQLLALNQSHEQALFNIQLMGMDDEQKLAAQRAEFDRLAYEAKKEQARGEAADQEKINRLLKDAQALNSAITAAAGAGSSEIAQAKEREIRLYELQKRELEATAQAHEANAAKAQTAQQTVQAALDATNASIDDITAKLKQDYALKVGVDLDSLTAAQAQIAELTKPETKTITIATINTGAGASVDNAHQDVQSNAAGGPIFGPGTGTSDSILSWLSNGEYVLRAAAVQKYGLPFLHRLNTMKLPRYAQGGPVALNMPALSAPAMSGGSSEAPIHIHLPDGQQFGPFNGSQDTANALAAALNIEALKRGRRR